MAAGPDIGGEWGHQVLAVGGQPAFAAVADDAGPDDQILDDEVLVTLEDRSGGGSASGTTTSSVMVNWAVLGRLAEPGRF